MSDDTHDDMSDLVDPSGYEDPVSQRAMAFCHVAKLADTVQDETVKELCLTMLRKLNASGSVRNFVCEAGLTITP